MPRKATPKADTILASEALVRPALAWLDADPDVDVTETITATEDDSIGAPGIPASVKSGRILLPSIMETKQFKELQANVDAIESRMDFFAQQHNIGGFIEDSIPTGCLSYDFAMGGGLPIGKFVSHAGPEQSGKSTLFNTLVPWSVNYNIPVYWFDPESARDPTYAERIFNRFGMSLIDIQGRRSKDGKHWDVLPMVRYTNHHIGEDIFNAMAGILLALPEIKKDPNGQWWERVPEGQWVESASQGAPQYLFLIDSFPAMLPELVQESLEAKGDKSGQIGIQARMFSDNLKKVKAALTSRRCTLLGNNQIRMKPMAMGCLHSDVEIPLVDGRSFTMREIVEQQIAGQVWSLNEATGKLEPKNILSWHNNGQITDPEDWVSIKTAAVGTPDGVSSVTVTPNHEIFANGSWVSAENVQIGDLVTTRDVETGTSVTVSVVSITRGSADKFKLRTKYDITVEGNHNYMAGNPVNGFIVHNSPEVEPGGEALKFYTDARFQVRRVSPSTAGAKRTEGGAIYNEEPSINGGTDKYTYSKLRNTKNKMYTPYREGAIRIRMEHEGHPGDGIDMTYDVLQYLDATGQLVKGSQGRYKLEVRGVNDKGAKPSIFGANFSDTAMPYMTLKKIIEAPENKQGLWKHCLRQIRSGFAFDIEQEMIDKAEGRGPTDDATPVDIPEAVEED